MHHPLLPAIFQIGGPILWVILAVWLLSAAVRQGELSRMALLFFAGTTLWWQEWYADWASYLLFSYDFAQIPWDHTVWTAPSKPWAVIPSYGWYFGLAFGFMAWLVDRVRSGKPGWKPFFTTLVVVGPLFYVWDLVVEGAATALAWWQYTNNIGPELKTPNGNFPILWPISLFVFCAVVMVWIFVKRDPQGRFMHESLLGISPRKSGLGRELARFASASVTLNLVFWFLLVFPTCLLRYFFGGSSSLVP